MKAAAATTLSALCQVRENLPMLREQVHGFDLVSVCETIVSNLDKGVGVGVGGSSSLEPQQQQQSNEESMYARRTAEILHKLKVKVKVNVNLNV